MPLVWFTTKLLIFKDDLRKYSIFPSIQYFCEPHKIKPNRVSL